MSDYDHASSEDVAPNILLVLALFTVYFLLRLLGVS